MEVQAKKAKVQAWALVRDKNGKPSFADINNIPDVFWNLLTEDEKEEIRNDRIALSRNS